MVPWGRKNRTIWGLPGLMYPKSAELFISGLIYIESKCLKKTKNLELCLRLRQPRKMLPDVQKLAKRGVPYIHILNI